LAVPQEEQRNAFLRTGSPQLGQGMSPRSWDIAVSLPQRLAIERRITIFPTTWRSVKEILGLAHLQKRKQWEGSRRPFVAGSRHYRGLQSTPIPIPPPAARVEIDRVYGLKNGIRELYAQKQR